MSDERRRKKNQERRKGKKERKEKTTVLCFGQCPAMKLKSPLLITSQYKVLWKIKSKEKVFS